MRTAGAQQRHERGVRVQHRVGDKPGQHRDQDDTAFDQQPRITDRLALFQAT